LTGGWKRGKGRLRKVDMTGIFGGGFQRAGVPTKNSSNKLPSLMRDTDRHHGDIDSAGRSRPYFLRIITCAITSNERCDNQYCLCWAPKLIPPSRLCFVILKMGAWQITSKRRVYTSNIWRWAAGEQHEGASSSDRKR
jgi:hypothetical protein